MKRILFLQIPSITEEENTAFQEACLSLTPRILSCPQNSLLLDIGITEKTFGGEEKLLFAASQLWEAYDLEPQLVVVDRPEWAWPLSERILIVPPNESEKSFLSLPIHRLVFCGDPKDVESQLREREQLILFMQRVGMRRIGDFTRLSPLAINRRFGKFGCELHEWALGRRELLIPSFFPQLPIQEKLDTEEVTSMDQLVFFLRTLLLRVEARLFGRGQAAKLLGLKFILDTSADVNKTLTLSEPTRNANSLLRILRVFLEDMEWGSPLRKLEIEVLETAPYQRGQLSLFDEAENRFSDLGEYVNRLRTRFGDESVGFPSLLPNHLPEKSWEPSWPPSPPSFPKGDFPLRPLFLFTPPKPYQISPHARLTPSENLASHWWESLGERRYYILETPKENLWVYWDTRHQSWFLHGTFD